MDIWGDLPKGQTDPQTINEAIDALIQAHDDDADAHLDASQSLQSHKASEIIDHLADSIIEDKIATGEISSRCITTDQIVGKDIRTEADVGAAVDGVAMLPTGLEMWQGGEKQVDIPVSGDPTFRGVIRALNFEYLRDSLIGWFGNHTGWTDYGTVTDGSLNIQLATTNATNSYAYIDTDGFQAQMDKNVFFEFKAALGATTSQVFHAIFGTWFDEASDPEKNYIGIKVVNNVVSACIFINDTEYLTTLSGVSFSAYVYKRFTVKVTSGSKIEFYVDGVLKHTETTNIPADPTMGGDVIFHIKTTTTAVRYLNLKNLVIMQD